MITHHHTRHRLANLIYCLVAGFGQSLQTSRQNYVIHFRRARAGTELAVRRVADLLALWLRQRQVNPAELQTTVDQFLEPARQAANKSRSQDTSSSESTL